jgi:alpha-beta hydrolase superfamily lysophospholipase
MVTTKDGLKLHTAEWRAKDPSALVFLVHGYAEHSKRYDHFASFLNQNNITLVAYDQRGHGESQGETAYIHDGQYLIEDLHQFISTYYREDIPCFVFGHSMGGLVTAAYFLSEYKDTHDIKGIILSAPGLMPSKAISPFLIKISGFLGKYFPKLKTIKLDPTAVSSDPNEVEKYVNDPLVYSGKWIARTGAELVKMMNRVQEQAKNFNQAFFLGHGDKDKIAEIEGSRKFFMNASTEDKAFKTYEGFYHELLNEPGRQEFMDDVFTWIKDRV